MTEEITAHVIKSASVLDTAFLARFDGLLSTPRHPTVYRHGQYKGARVDGTHGSARTRARAEGERECECDNHHSPITPGQYLDLRVRPQLAFYQKRMPRYERARSLFEALLLLASLAGTVLAFAKLASWTTIAASVTATVTAYSKFLTPEKKLQRFSDAVIGIDSTLLWWTSLTDVEQASPGNVSSLVRRCEEMFQLERQAWVSTAMNNSALKEATGARTSGEQQSSVEADGGAAVRRPRGAAVAPV